MSDALIGTELLPNVYIKRIRLFGKRDQMRVRVSVCVMDKSNEKEKS